MLKYNMIKPGVYYLKGKTRAATSEDISFLNNESIEKGIDITRLCLHEDEESKLMSMVLLVRNYYVYPAHRHSWKDESYTVLKGKMEYQELGIDSKVSNKIILSEGETLLNISRTFHRIIPKTPILCFLENTVGPFNNRPLEFL